MKFNLSINVVTSLSEIWGLAGRYLVAKDAFSPLVSPLDLQEPILKSGFRGDQGSFSSWLMARKVDRDTKWSGPFLPPSQPHHYCNPWCYVCSNLSAFLFIPWIRWSHSCLRDFAPGVSSACNTVSSTLHGWLLLIRYQLKCHLLRWTFLMILSTEVSLFHHHSAITHPRLFSTIPVSFWKNHPPPKDKL